MKARVARERLRLFRVRAVLECARLAMEYAEEAEFPASDVSLALDVTRELVERVIGELDSERLGAPGTESTEF